MKNRTCKLFSLLLLIFGSISETFASPKSSISPLIGFSEEWKDEKYLVANTARLATYMSETEREVIYILNLVRMDPSLFEKTVLRHYPAFSSSPNMKSSEYFKSLTATLKKISPVKILLPNKFCFESAQCHASTSGKSGYVGHERQNALCKKSMFYFGECISYGYNNALDIVMALLIDENVPSLGHRKNFLGDFKSIGVSIQPHTTYRYNAVIDLAD